MRKAEALALAGRPEEALASLQRAFDDGSRLLWRWDTVHKRNFDSIRERSEFSAIVASIEADLKAQVAAFDADASLP